MNRMEICGAARQFAGELAALSARGDVNGLLSPDNLLVGERSVSLRSAVPPPPGPVGVYAGFSAPEVYMGQAGPASGVYFVGAVVYLLMFGSIPPDARTRAGAPAIPNAQDPLSQLVNAAMEPNPAMRVGSFAALQNAMAGVYAQMQAALPRQQPAPPPAPQPSAFTPPPPPMPQGMAQPPAFTPPPAPPMPQGMAQQPAQPQEAARQPEQPQVTAPPSAFAPPAPPMPQGVAQPQAVARPPEQPQTTARQPEQPQSVAAPSAFTPPAPPMPQGMAQQPAQPREAARQPEPPQVTAAPSAFTPPPMPQGMAQQPEQPQSAAAPSAFTPPPPPMPQGMAQQPAQPREAARQSVFAPLPQPAQQGMARPQGMAPQPPRPPVPPPPKKKKKRTGLMIGIIAAALVVVLGGCFAGYTVYQQGEADKAYEDSDWEAYKIAMDAAPWLKNDENGPQYDYCTARLLEDDGDSDGALELYDELADFEDCEARANSIRYDAAVGLMDSGELEDSLAAFLELGSYSDSADYAYDIEAYLAAEELEDPLDRYYAFSDLSGFLDSDDKAAESAGGIYDAAVELYEESSFSEAQDMFDLIGDYEQAERYSYACSMADDYYYSNLAEYEELEQEGIAVGHIMLSKAYYRGFLDGIWYSDDGGGTFTYTYSVLGSVFSFEDVPIDDGSYEYDNGTMTPVDGDSVIYFAYTDFNSLAITITGYGTYNFVRS